MCSAEGHLRDAGEVSPAGAKERCCVPLMKYKGVDGQGERVEGLIDAPSVKSAGTVLAERGWQIEAVAPFENRGWFSRVWWRLSARELDRFNELLLTVLRNGRAPGEALRTLAEGERRPRLREALRRVADAVESGMAPADAVAGLGERLPPFYVGLVRAAGRRGALTEALAHVAASPAGVARGGTLTGRTALGWLLVIGALGWLFCMVLLVIVPAYAGMFADFGAVLPWPTRYWVGVSMRLRSGFGVPLLAALWLAAVFWSLLSAGRNAPLFHAPRWLARRVPLVGRLCPVRAMGRFSRVLGALVAAKAPLVEALDLAGAASGDGGLRLATREAAVDIVGGATLADALADTGNLDHAFCWAVASHEEHGRLAETLASLADGYDKMASRGPMSPSGAFWFAVVVGLILALGAVVFSLYLPMFTFTDMFSGL